MENQAHRSIYRRIKWIWLLSQCAMPVLAALYLARYFVDHPIESPFFRFLLQVSGSLYLILWLIAEALLCLYRFPLELSRAATLVGGFIAQFAVLALTGESLGFAAFTGLYVTLAALYGCLVVLVVAFSRELVWKNKRRGLAAIALLTAGGIPLYFLFFPLWAAYGQLSVWLRIVNGAVLAGNTAFTIRSLIDFSIWGNPDPQHDAYYKEWEKWAAPTIILLILTAAAAAMIVGVHGATHSTP